MHSFNGFNSALGTLEMSMERIVFEGQELTSNDDMHVAEQLCPLQDDRARCIVKK